MRNKLVSSLVVVLLSTTICHVKADSITDIEKSISNISNKTEQINKKKSDIQKDVNSYQITMNENSKKIDILNMEVTSIKENINNQMRSLQINNGFTSTILNVIVSSNSLQDLIQKTNAIATIKDAEDQSIKQLSKKTNEIKALNKDNVKQMDKLYKANKDLDNQINSLNSDKDKLNRQLKDAKDKAAKEAKVKADKEAKEKAEALKKAEEEEKQTESKSKQSDSNKNKDLKPEYKGGLNLNQVDGQVSVELIAQYMVGVYNDGNLDDWITILNKESRGVVNAQNPTSTAYGVFQILTCPPGSTLGQQLALAHQYFNSTGGNTIGNPGGVSGKAQGYYSWVPDLSGSYNGQL